jgi:diguanylate cyclase (GGDEF)-like protein
MNVSRASSYVAGGIKDKVLRSVYSLFERIDILDIDNDRVQTVHESRGRFRGRYDDLSPQEGVIEFARLNIHPEDQERFIQLYTIPSLMELLQKSRHSFHSSLFRIHEGDGVYVRQLFIQSMVRLDGRRVILSMLLDNEGTASEIGNSLYDSALTGIEIPQKSSDDPVDSAIPKSALFDSLIQAVPCGVFWKDKNRRFLGVNRFFLDFYGFSSPSVIIGNTDEDMGWHVDPFPFMRDEYDVLKGKSIFDASGSCIVRGIDHQIKASKFPVYKNGSIIGLIGMFKDLGPNIDDPNASIDELTGLLNSRGAIEAFNRYEKSYREKKIDFCIISIDINSFSEFNHQYGSQAANDLLNKVGRVLAAIMGESGVVSRIGGDEFVILHQISDRSQIDHYEYEIASAVSTIQSIQGIPVTVSITTESILFSESPSARVRTAEEKAK